MSVRIASVGLAYAAFNSITWREVGQALLHFPVGHVLLALVPLAAATLLRAARWWVLLRGERISLFHVFVSQTAGIGLQGLPQKATPRDQHPVLPAQQRQMC